MFDFYYLVIDTKFSLCLMVINLRRRTSWIQNMISPLTSEISPCAKVGGETSNNVLKWFESLTTSRDGKTSQPASPRLKKGGAGQTN
jgi:hypothetical protein